MIQGKGEERIRWPVALVGKKLLGVSARGCCSRLLLDEGEFVSVKCNAPVFLGVSRVGAA